MTYTAGYLNFEQFLSVLSLTNTAFALHVTETAIIEFANDAMLKIWDKDRSVIGKSLEEALPELKGQPFIEMFARVWREGITISGTDTAAHLIVDGKLQTFYFDFEYRAIKNSDGEVYCILHTATDVTERVLSVRREQSLMEELRAANEELSAANEELYQTNEELNESQDHLKQLYEELAESNARFRSMVRQAPIGMCIIRATDLFVQEVNDEYLEMVGKPRSEFEKQSIWQAIPEVADIYAPVMNRVIETGEAFVAKEHEVMLIRNGVAEVIFVDFVYEPMFQDGKVAAVMVLVIDVSDKVKARKSIEEVEERIRLAVDAAEMGTFDADLLAGHMLTSPRFNQILGLKAAPQWSEILAMINPDDRLKRDLALDKALKNGELFYEARLKTNPGGMQKWIRVQGKVYFNSEGKPYRMLGTLLDITHYKKLVQQKDDFISIASHELKTPITSLKASLQLLERMKNNPNAETLPKLIEQSTKSMRKISGLVDDLLNVSRTNQVQLTLNKSNFALADAIETCRSLISVAGDYNLIVKGDETLQLYGDERAVDQVIVNLVNNAVKYAPASKEIILGVENKGDVARISVTDKGPGISSDKIAHLFDRYYQAQPSGFNNSGLGLGLYICADIIKRHGGQIGVDSTLGQGSSFWFTLPFKN